MIAGVVERSSAVGAETVSLPGANPESVQSEVLTEPRSPLKAALERPFIEVIDSWGTNESGNHIRKRDILLFSAIGVGIALGNFTNLIP